MFCTKCGKQIADTSVYCKYCGTKAILPKRLQRVEKAEEENSFSSNKENGDAVIMMDSREESSTIAENNTTELLTKDVEVITDHTYVIKDDAAVIGEDELAIRNSDINGEDETVIRSDAAIAKEYVDHIREQVDITKENIDFIIENDDVIGETVDPIKEADSERDKADISSNIVENATGNVLEDTTENATGSVIEDLRENAIGNETGNVIEDLTENATGNVIEDITENAKEKETGNVTGNITDDITGKKTENTVENIRSNITENTIENITENVSANIAENITADNFGKTNKTVYKNEEIGFERAIDQINEKNESHPLTEKKIVENDTSQLAVPKKRNKKVLLIVSVLVVALLGAGVGGYLYYQKFLQGKAEIVVKLFDEGEFEEALAIYEKYCEDKDSLEDSVRDAFLERIDIVKVEYLSEVIDYEIVKERIDAILEYENKKLIREARELEEWAEIIYDSRASFQKGKTLLESGDYSEAIHQFEMVEREDTAYYNLASVGIIEANRKIQEEEERIKEIERMDAIRKEALSEAEYYSKEYDYDSAIKEIEEALVEIPGDSELIESLTYYKDLLAKSLVIDINNVTTATYEYTYKGEDSDILTVNIRVPKIKGELNSYQKINDVFAHLMEKYTLYCEDWAEQAKEYSEDEYFFTNSFDLEFDITYNNNGVFGVLMEGYEYTGGAHGNPFRLVYVFDIASGSEIHLEDLVTVDENTFWNYAVDAFEKLIETDPSLYWDDAIQTVSNYSGFEFKYYLTAEGIHLYADPYELASYAEGFVEVVIPYAGNEAIFAFIE